MRFTRHEMMVSAAVKFKPVFFGTVCYCCDDTILFDMMYSVSSSDTLYHICRSCAKDKHNAYEMINPRPTTIQSILIRNAEHATKLAMQKVSIAQEGLRQVIKTIQEPSADWNPIRDKVAVSAVVAAENTLREIDKEDKVAQPVVRKKAKKKDAAVEAAPVVPAAQTTQAVVEPKL